MDAPVAAPTAPAPTPEKAAPVSKFAIMVAMRESQGNRQEAARKLGLNDEYLKQRILDDPQLSSLYVKKAKDTPPPTAIEAAARKPEDRPPQLPQNATDSLKVISLVSPEDTERLLDGLANFDFSAKSLERIRLLGNLAADTGRFIAVSLEKTHQNYIVQQFGLMELAADIRRRLSIPKGEADYVSDEETRAMLHHTYVEMVKESGRGVNLSIEMAEVITRMLEAAGSKAKKGKVKMGWKQAKAVTSSEPPPSPDA